MAEEPRKARDLALLDAIDAFRREPFSGPVWRVVREGRDPILGGPSRSRWCNGTFDALYTSMEADGALAEIYTFLTLQPVFPAMLRLNLYKLDVAVEKALKLADLPTLARLGVDVAAFAERDYRRTQDIADAAYFLGFDGVIAPSARWERLNVTLFTDRIAPSKIDLTDTPLPVDWDDWRKRTRRR